MTLNTRRRNLMAALGGALPLLATPGWAAAASATPIPAALVELDQAAMTLFDAAEAADWAQAGQALARVRTAAGDIAPLELAFVQAGGELHRFFEARNDLTGDIIEARTALSVRDGRWLTSTASRIAARAGELSQPFAMRADSLVPRVEALLYLARNLRQALVWQDDAGFDSAREDFNKLWKLLRLQLKDVPAARVQALDNALAGMALSATATGARQLYSAVQGIRVSRAVR